MSNAKISALTSATTPLAGTEVLPVVQSGVTKQVSVADLTAGRNIATAAITSTVNTANGAGYQITNSNNSAYVTIQVNGATGSGVTNWANSTVIESVPASTGGLTFGAYTGDINFQTNYRTITPLTLKQTGDVNVNAGNLVIGTSGKGIDFSATAGTGTSELLADYEEGTWTPTVTPATGSFTTVTISSAVYTKIGRYVTLQTTFVLTNSGTGAGSMTISGIPFTISSTYSSAQQIGRRVNDAILIIGQLGSVSIQTITLTTGLTAIVNGNTYTFTATYIT